MANGNPNVPDPVDDVAMVEQAVDLNPAVQAKVESVVNGKVESGSWETLPAPHPVIDAGGPSAGVNDLTAFLRVLRQIGASGDLAHRKNEHD